MADKQVIERSREGVPKWDGDSRTFQEYEEMALMWEQGIPHHKRDLCGPRLVSELSGAARRFIVGKKPGWVSFHGGVGRLLQHLRTHLGLPQIPEMTEYLLKYFKNGKRKRQESMGEYITRKCEIYARARQSLSRLMASQGPGRNRVDELFGILMVLPARPSPSQFGWARG